MKRTESIMGMPITIEVVGDGASIDTLITQAFDEFRRIDAVFSTYKISSEISRINAHKLMIDDASAEMQEVLESCERLKSETNGYFDISYRGILDPSGYVKGWTIGRVEWLLRQGKADNFVVSAGGDIVCAGHRADGTPWSVGIANPTSSAESIKNLNLSDRSIATSATYERGDHIYNPLTKQTVNELTSVSIIGPDIVMADVYATTVFVMGKAGIDWIQTKPDYAAYILTSDSRAVLTPNLQAYIAA